LLPDIAAVSEN